MLGAIAGDIIASRFEFDNHKSTDFALFDAEKCFFTDDSVLSIALADAILHDLDYAQTMRAYYQRYPRAGFGTMFTAWARNENSLPYYSWGNGAAMRISPVGYAFDSLELVLQKAEEFTEITHNHPEGLKGAAATASAIFLARTGQSKDQIKSYIEVNFGYDLNRSCDEIRPHYQFNESSQQTVPEAVIAFLESTDFENALRLAVSLGGDSDTLTCITGGIAQAFYGVVPKEIAEKTLLFLDKPLGLMTVEFMQRYCSS